jgi:ribonucleoside-diphosphate reductase alpha chain
MKVIKRNDLTENFNINKIAKALLGVYQELGLTYTFDECLTHTHSILEGYKHLDTIHIEDIQNDVEIFLMKNISVDAARAYIRYRDIKAQNRAHPWHDFDERQDLILSKYLKPNETKKEFIERISLGQSSLAKIFRNKEALWGGRNLFAIGREGNITGSNCYVVEAPEDSLKDIYDIAYKIARTYSYGGGQGMNLSKLRPKGALVNNSSNTTPGVMTFAELYSFITLNTQQQNRRGALMLVLDIDHPDIVDFITTKLQIDKINGANISLAVTDKFLTAVQNDEMWELFYETPHEIIKKQLKAKDLMNLIAYTNHTVGDPGFLFIDKINNYHLLSEYTDIKFNATNPCGEQPLLEGGSCNLASINLNAFVKNPFTDKAYFNFERFGTVIKEMIWGLDNLLTLFEDRHPLESQKEHVKNYREIGLGIMGVADLALSMKMAYGSKPFLELLDVILFEMANLSAQASTLKAEKDGPFQLYDYNKISQSTFFKNVYTPATKELIQKFGLRNSRLLSIAPTGSISNLFGVSGGIEPFFLLNYERTIMSIGKEPQVITVWEKTPKALAKTLNIPINNLPSWALVTSQNLDVKDRAMIQSIAQKYIDSAISSTFNIPNHYTTEDITFIYQMAWKDGLKGVTVFRDNCAKMGILSAQFGQEVVDKNPAMFPSFIIEEEWTNKTTKETKKFQHEIILEKHNIKAINQKELCPECGSPLQKSEGCIKCVNKDCYYEACSW